jgi:CotH kinase protein
MPPLILALLACRPDPHVESADIPWTNTEIPPAPEDTGSPPDPDSEPRPELDALPIFDDTVLHRIEISLGEDAKNSLRADPYEWVEGGVSIDGEVLASVGIRLRGKLGSFRPFDEKPKFKIDFNHYADQRFQGLESLSLNNEVVDCSYLREPTGYAVYAAMGLPSPRVSYTTVTVDGEAYGLYVVVEVPDDNFLRDRYEEPQGRLYDGKYLYYGDRESAELVDFTRQYQDNFQLEEGEDDHLRDIYAVTAAIDDYRGSFRSRLGTLVDLPNFHRNLAVEQWIGHLDGYALNANNYRVYFNPWDGRAEIIPWDLDYSFLPTWKWGMSWKRPNGALAAACWEDADCFDDHRPYVEEILQTVDVNEILVKMDAWTSLIETAAMEDPRRVCATTAIQPEQAALKAFVAARPADLELFWERN